MLTFAEFAGAVRARVVDTVGRTTSLALVVISTDDELELRLRDARVRLIYVSSSNALLAARDIREPARSVRLDTLGVDEATGYIARVLLCSLDEI